VAKKKEIVLDGNRFSNLNEFYLEAERQLTKDFQSGRNLDAFSDLLRGSFLVTEYEEPIRLIWRNSAKSKEDLSWDETLDYLQAKLSRSDPSWIPTIGEEIRLARAHQGPTLYDRIVEMIRGHPHIEFMEE
jgi:RNAse (barnase) inhibitor barstar